MKNVKILHEWNWRLIFWHVIGWSIFIAYEVSGVVIMNRPYKNIFWLFATNYFVGVLIFYAHCLFFVPLAVERGGPWAVRALVIFAIEVVIYTIVADQLDWLYYKTGILQYPKGLVMDFNYWVIKAYRCIFFCIFSTGYYIMIRAIREQREKMEIRLEKQKIENAFLKAQINPHFLFNTLNFIRHKVKETLPAMGDALMVLSDIMRYSIDTEQSGDEVDLWAEIQEVENFISLHRMRIEYPLNLEFNYEEDQIEGLKFTPLILMTLVENVFKHGDLSMGAPPVIINIVLEGQDLLIETYNRRRVNTEPSKHIGLANVRKRLAMFYKERVTMEAYEDEQNLFHVLLKIKSIR